MVDTKRETRTLTPALTGSRARGFTQKYESTSLLSSPRDGGAVGVVEGVKRRFPERLGEERRRVRPNDARGATHAIDPLSDVHTAVKSATGTKIIALIDVSSRFALPIAQAAKEVRARFPEDRGAARDEFRETDARMGRRGNSWMCA